MQPFTKKELAKIEKAVCLAEKKTSGEIVPLIYTAKFWQINLEKVAIQEFQKLGIEKTIDRTGILLALFPNRRKVVVVADKAINDRCSKDTWTTVVDLIIVKAKQGKVIDGFCAGIKRCGEILTREFPIKKNDRNELSNKLRIVR
jgi:uncharacterized membrane protein